MLSNQEEYSLRVDMMDWERNKVVAVYDNFLVEDEDEGYRLHISGYHGTAGESLMRHDKMKFSTHDADNDLATDSDFRGGNCAQRFGGGWWYYKCYMANPTGRYYRGGETDNKHDAVAWKAWKGSTYSLKKIEMKIRPKRANLDHPTKF